MEVQKILIVKPSSFGDVIHALPVLHALRRKHPRAHIGWLVKPEFAPLLEGNPALDEVIPFERGEWSPKNLRGNARELRKLVKRLREARFDVAIDLQGLFRSGWLAWKTGAPTRVGFARARELAWIFYNVRVKVPDRGISVVDQYLLAAKALGVDAGEPEFGVWVSPEAERFAQEYAGREAPAGAPLVVMLPGSRGESKRWPAERFAELADRLAQSRAAVSLFLGGTGDATLVAGIRGRMKAKGLDLAGKTSILQSAALMKRAALVVGNDSGPMHLAAALGRPVVALFGPTSPRRSGPRGPNARVIAARTECGPCFRWECGRKDCMKSITTDEVLREAESLLEGAR